MKLPGCETRKVHLIPPIPPWHRLVARIEGTHIADDQAIQAVHRHEPWEIQEEVPLEKTLIAF